MAIAPAVGPTLKNITAGRRYVKNGNVCKTESNGLKNLSNFENFQAIIPSNKPTTNATGAATTKTESVSIANFHWPISAVQINVPPPKRANLQPPR